MSSSGIWSRVGMAETVPASLSASTLIGAFPGAVPPLVGWAAVMGDLAPAAVVPGHGPPGARDDLTDMAAYLRQVEAMIGAVAAGDWQSVAAHAARYVKTASA